MNKDAELRSTILELDRDLSRSRDEARALRRLALRALALAGAHIPDLRSVRNEVEASLDSDSIDLAALDRATGQLTDFVRRAPPADGGTAVDARWFQGLHRFPALSEALAELEALLQEPRLDAQRLVRQLDLTFDQLHTDCQRAENERARLAELVGNVWSKIETVTAALTGDETVTDAARNRLQSFGDAISIDIADLRGEVVELSDVESLRRSILGGLDRITDRIQHFRDVHEAELLAALERNRGMRGELQQLHGTVQALTDDLARAEAAAQTDALTGLPNRHALERAFRQLSEHPGPNHVAVFDVDHFKSVNDRYGHSAGDKILQVIAKLLARTFPSPHFVARYGGEEFVVLVRGDAEEAARMCDAARQAVESLVVRNRGERVQLTISVGLAEAPARVEGHEAFKRADRALYSAKASGRNRLVQA
ncbi:MAG: diguanylate cyclase [Thioalkalivibrionaceae bacterium]